MLKPIIKRGTEEALELWGSNRRSLISDGFVLSAYCIPAGNTRGDNSCPQQGDLSWMQGPDASWWRSRPMGGDVPHPSAPTPRSLRCEERGEEGNLGSWGWDGKGVSTG